MNLINPHINFKDIQDENLEKTLIKSLILFIQLNTIKIYYDGTINSDLNYENLTISEVNDSYLYSDNDVYHCIVGGVWKMFFNYINSKIKPLLIYQQFNCK